MQPGKGSQNTFVAYVGGFSMPTMYYYMYYLWEIAPQGVRE